MSQEFVRLTLEEFREVVTKFPWSRTIEAVHLHHTFRPDHASFRGLASIRSMERFHMEENGWSAIAQHVTIAPDGGIWTGRSWNKAPASSSGHNGNSMLGPFMIETVGNFDVGHDKLEGDQLAAVIGVIAHVQQHFKLRPTALRFHRQLGSPKTCPGTGCDFDSIVELVEAQHDDPEGASVPPVDEAIVAGAINAIKGTGASRSTELGNEEPSEEAMSLRERAILDSGGTFSGGARGDSKVLAAEELDVLRPYVINLDRGQFSTSGIFQTTPEDVDRIFDEELQKAFDDALAKKRPLRIVFWAHGGLVDENSGLWTARKQIEWWLRNGVYPIHFAWETGLAAHLKPILLDAAKRVLGLGARDLADITSDPLIEVATRALGSRVWDSMKLSAEKSSTAGGGALYAATKLVAFLKGKPADSVELHAIGHSAGAIFHSHFIPAALAAGVPKFKTLSLLAPAVRVDLFKKQLLPKIAPNGKEVECFSLFTMRKDIEKGDNCIKVYQKSLLYLVSLAFERGGKAAILGLEEWIRKDKELCKLLGVGAPTTVNEVIWSTTETDVGRSSSRSIHHGAFDDDTPTMNSVLRRVLDVSDTAPIQGFVTSDRPADWPFIDAPESRDADEEFLARLTSFIGQQTALSAAVGVGGASSSTVTTTTATTTLLPASGGGGGARRALCIGIDEYDRAPLNGCVNDARDWEATLRALGFSDIRTLFNRDAKRDRIVAELQSLISNSRAGDVLVFQYAGHGTQLPDVSGDEGGGDREKDGKDEAIVPVDFTSGQFLIDDDIQDLFAQIPDGVSLTCFFDCCHSGEMSRFGGAPHNGTSAATASDVRMRFLRPSASVIEEYRRLRRRDSGTRTLRTRAVDDVRAVSFSACQSHEVAFESDGHGAFTLIATKLLRGGVALVTNEGFLAQVRKSFGAGTRQLPQLQCPSPARSFALLQALVRGN